MKVLKNYAPMCTSEFGDRTYWHNGKLVSDFHYGIDVVANINGVGGFDNVISVASGTVELVVNNIAGYVGGASYGNQIVINHGNGFKTRYAHTKQWSIPLNVGDSVQEGQVIGYMGCTGTITAGHLHFEVIHNGNVIDPYDYVFNGKTFETVTQAVARNESIDQLKVNVTDLRVRNGVGTNQPIIGLAQKDGIYNYYETKISGDLTWYRIAEGQWLASKDYWCTIYPYIAPIEPPKEEVIQEDTDKPIDVVEPIKTSIWVELFKFIIKFIKEMFKK